MKVWKSPVLYIGILLVLAVAGALAAPFVIDWNGYRADLESYGRRLAGREVRIEGPIAVRLFPWPRLTAENVRLANPPGVGNGEFATAERVVVRMSLAGLLGGNVQVESIDVDRPAIALVRLASGQNNWDFVAGAGDATERLLDRVKLDRIRLHGGQVKFVDEARRAAFAVADVEAELSASVIGGPWRLRGSAAYRERRFDIGLNTGAWKPEEAFRFSFRVAPSDGSGLALSFDGETEGGRAAGRLRIEPAADPQGKSDAEGRIRPLVFQSKIVATFDAVAFDSIEIGTMEGNDGATLVTGSAKLALGTTVAAAADLSATRIDLDQLAGAGARQLLREGGGLAVVDGLLAMLPADLSVRSSFKVTSLQAGGEVLENVVARIDADRQAIRVRELSASLPGRSRALFDGVFFPGKSGAELAGKLALETGDLRQLVGWAWPEKRAAIAETWTGSRGHFKLQTDISLTAARLRLDHAQYEIDGLGGSGEFAYAAEGRGAYDLRLDASEIDLDSFVPHGLSAVSSGGTDRLSGLLAYLVPGEEAGSLRLTLQAGKLRLNGVEAEDVAIDLASGSSGLDLRTLSIGSVGGARLEGTGLVLDSEKGPDGSVSFDVSAEDPRGLVRLLGLMPDESEPAWTRGLGATAVKATLGVKPGKLRPVVSFDVAGTTGELTIAAAGTVDGVGSDLIDISATADVKSPSSRALAELAGLTAVTPTAIPGNISATISGNGRDGYLADIQSQLFGAHVDYNGRIDPAKGGLGLAGRVALRSTDAAPLLVAIGLPVAGPPAGVLVLDAEVTGDGEGTAIDAIDGRIGEAAIAGTLKLDPAWKMSGNLAVGSMALRDVLAAVFLEWSGRAPTLESSFATSLPLGLMGELWIKPKSLEVHSSFVASDAQIGISATGEETRLVVFGKDPEGRDVRLDVASRRDGERRAIEGKLGLPIDLARQLQLETGQAIAAGTGMVDVAFRAGGRSPAGSLAVASGSGSYVVDALKILGLSPAEFSRRAAAAGDNAALLAAFAALRSGEGVDAGRVQGLITIDNGTVSFLPFSVKTEGATFAVKPIAELSEGAIDIAMTLGFAAMPDLPAMEISYAGPPSALVRSEDAAELTAKLGFRIMEQGVKELERLQQEQQRLAAEEERMRAEDEAKLKAYYAQRDELRRRQQEVKVHQVARKAEEERQRIAAEKQRLEYFDLNRKELQMRVRELRTHRRLAKLAQELADPGSLDVTPQPRVKPAVPRRAPSDETGRPGIQVPAILVPPSQQ